MHISKNQNARASLGQTEENNRIRLRAGGGPRIAGALLTAGSQCQRARGWCLCSADHSVTPWPFSAHKKAPVGTTRADMLSEFDERYAAKTGRYGSDQAHTSRHRDRQIGHAWPTSQLEPSVGSRTQHANQRGHMRCLDVMLPDDDAPPFYGATLFDWARSG